MKMRSRNKKWFVLFPVLFIGALFLFGWIVMLLWNAVLVPAAGAAVITFWQGLGLLVLCRILVGGFGGGGRSRGNRWRGKWMSMSAEEKAQFQEEWKQRCGKDFNETRGNENLAGSQQ
jgi:hypothetical protein